MMSFDRLFSQHVNQQKTDITALADYCQADPNVLRKWLRGKDKPKTPETVRKICWYLALSPDATRQMLNAYYRCLWGDDAYDEFLSICQFFTHFSPGSQTIDTGRSFYTGTDSLLEGDVCTFDTPRDLLGAMATLFTQSDTSPITLVFQPEQEHLTNLVMAFKQMLKRPVKHFLCFDNLHTGDEKGARSMIACLHQALTFHGHLKDYTVSYYYGNADALFSPFSLNQGLILTDTEALTFSTDLRRGICYRTPETVALFRAYADHLDTLSRPVFVEIQNLKEQYQAFNVSDGNTAILSAEPHLFPLLSRELIEDNLPEGFPDRLQVKDNLFDFLTFVQQSESSNNITSYFTRKGLISFTETGLFTEVFSNMFPSLSPRRRVELLKRFRQRVIQGRAFLLDDVLDPLSPTLHLGITDSTLSLLVRTPEDRMITAVLDEPGIVNRFSRFFGHLKDYGLVERRQHALDAINACIDDLIYNY